MRNSVKKPVAIVASLVMTVALFAGGFTSNSVRAAEENLLTNAWTHTHDNWELNDAKVANTQVSNNADGGFTANISITGWQREWYGEEYMPDDVWPFEEGWCDKPYQLTSDTTMSVEPMSTYKLTFEIVNSMTTEDGTTPQEKNVTVTVKDPDDNNTKFLFVTVRAPKNGSYSFERKFTIPQNYTKGTVAIQFAYGAYAYSYEISASPFLKLMPDEVREKYVFAPGTTEKVNASGKLAFNNISAMQVDYEEPTTKPEKDVTKSEEETTKTGGVSNGEACTCSHEPSTVIVTVPATESVTKPAKPTVTAKNVKSKKIKVSWKKVVGATKYQVRAVMGKKTIQKTTAKTKYVLKKLKKKKTYKVSVRAYNTAGYSSWSNIKKVKIKK